MSPKGQGWVRRHRSPVATVTIHFPLSPTIADHYDSLFSESESDKTFVTKSRHFFDRVSSVLFEKIANQTLRDSCLILVQKDQECFGYEYDL